MLKVITDIALLKKLQPYIEELQKERKKELLYFIGGEDEVVYDTYSGTFGEITEDIRTLTLEEAMEYIRKIGLKGLKMETANNGQVWLAFFNITPIFEDESLLQAISKLLNYLIDNNLLPKK